MRLNRSKNSNYKGGCEFIYFHDIRNKKFSIALDFHPRYIQKKTNSVHNSYLSLNEGGGGNEKGPLVVF